MATQPTDTAKVYVLTGAGSCFVTLIQKDKTITWQALPEKGGQTTFIVPAGGMVELSDPKCSLSALPFNYAPATVGLVSGGSYSGGSSFSTACRDANAVLSQMSWNAISKSCRTNWLRELLLQCATEDSVYIDLSACEMPAALDMSPNNPELPFIGFSAARMRLGSNSTGLKRFIMKAKSFVFGGNHIITYDSKETDFVLISAVGGESFAFTNANNGEYAKMKSLTVILPTATTLANNSGGYVSSSADTMPPEAINAPKRLIAPCLTSGVSFSYYRKNGFKDDRAIPINITACLPSYVSSFSFYKSCANSVSNLIYLMDNLGTPSSTSIPQLSFGIAADLVDTGGDAPIYHDAALAAAIARLEAKGWETVPYPVA